MSNYTDRRHVRVFISSTFRDMQEERDYLIKKAFPELRKRCRERGVEFTEVDLRWGVTAEQAERGEVLPICLREIENSRPYFICLLGERYGWVPPKEAISPYLFATEDWIADHLDRSVTEMEIIHGVFNNPAMHERAFFYFRDPAFAGEKEDTAIFREKSPELQEKLLTLKDRIRQSGMHLRENYQSSEELAAYIMEDLWSLIDYDFPAATVPGPLERERMEHELYASSRRQVYIRRDKDFNRIDAFVDSDKASLLITGESGSGKSALLANWAAYFREQHPDTLLIQHYCGSSVQSSDHYAILRRILSELKDALQMQQTIPDDNAELEATFPNWLAMASKEKKIILLLDGLDRIEDNENARELHWLPLKFPSNVRLIVSLQAGKVSGQLQERDWQTYPIEGLSYEERTAFIKDYLGHYRKALDEEQLHRIISAGQTTSPLYLKVLLDELRVFGVYEQLDSRIKHYLEAAGPAELYEKILERMEQDYEDQRPGLTGTALSLLWASRHGLTEKEILELLGTDGKQLPHAHWSPFFLALEDSLLSRNGLLTFSHDYLMQAAQQRYLPGEEAIRTAHRKLAAYFGGVELSRRKAEELPWQHMMAGDWEQLSDSLKDLSLLNTAWWIDQSMVKRYWALIGKHTGQTPATAYHFVLEQPETCLDSMMNLPLLLDHFGSKKEAITLYEKLQDHLEKSQDDNAKQEVTNIMNARAAILLDLGEPEAALNLFREAEERYRLAGDDAGVLNTYNNQAQVLTSFGQWDEALELHRKEEQWYRGHYRKHELARCLGNQALVLIAAEHYDEALTINAESIKLCSELGDREAELKGLCNKAVIDVRQGHLEKAMELNKQISEGFEELGDRKGLALALGNQAVVLAGQGHPQEALTLHFREQELYEALGDKAGLANSLGNQAGILNLYGETGSAQLLYDRQEQLYRELNRNGELTTCLGNSASNLLALERPTEAQVKLKEQEQLARDLGLTDELWRSLVSQGVVCQYNNDPSEALILYRQAGELCRQLGEQTGLRLCIFNQALVHNETENHEAALDCYREEESLFSDLRLSSSERAVNHMNQATVLETLERQGEALEQYGKAELYLWENEDHEGLTDCIGRQALILHDLDMPADALEKLLLQEQVAEKFAVEIEDVFKLLKDFLQEET